MYLAELVNLSFLSLITDSDNLNDSLFLFTTPVASVLTLKDKIFKTWYDNIGQSGVAT